MTKTTNEYLRPVLTWLQAGAPHEATGMYFDMTVFQEKDTMTVFQEKDTDVCGSTCCIAGAIAQFNGLDVGFDPQKDYSHIEACWRVGEMIGLTAVQTGQLFFGPAKANPCEAAVTLGHFMKTGVVIWDCDEEDGE